MVQPVIFSVPLFHKPPPEEIAPRTAVFPETVHAVMSSEPIWIQMPPPASPAWLFETVQPFIVAVASLKMPAPLFPATLPETVQPISDRAPGAPCMPTLHIPPPLPPLTRPTKLTASCAELL